MWKDDLLLPLYMAVHDDQLQEVGDVVCLVPDNMLSTVYSVFVHPPFHHSSSPN